MKRLKLVVAPSAILREKSRKVVIFDNRLHELAQEMYRVMRRHDGIGIAAPQVGVARRIIIVWNGESDTKPVVCINPEITAETGTVIMREGCLSFPGMFREIERAESIHVKFQNLKGKLETAELKGVLARCYQHELDHLDGRLFTDYQDKKVTECTL